MKQTLGTFFELGSCEAVEAIARSGLDYFVIDMEHGPYSVESALALIRAAEAAHITPFVRVGGHRRPDLLRVLDVGARGIIVPQVHSAADVKELVRHAKFPPVGSRGFCYTRTSGWGADAGSDDCEGYMRKRDAACLLLPQCETRGAYEEIEQIAAMEGVDGIFIGPFDLSIGLGVPMEMDHPILKKAIEDVLAACRRHGKLAFIFAGNVQKAAEYRAMGFDSVAIGQDTAVLCQAYTALAKEFWK